VEQAVRAVKNVHTNPKPQTHNLTNPTATWQGFR